MTLRSTGELSEGNGSLVYIDEHALDTDAGECSSEEVEIVVKHIKRLSRAASLEFALRVGAVIIHYFYAGDTNAWRSRGPKTASFRRLAQHPELPLSPGALYRCVALFELCDRLNAAARWENLGASHLRQVLGLPPEVQEKLLILANTQRWTVRNLQEEASRTKLELVHPQRGGRRPQHEIVKSIRALRKCLSVHEQVVKQARPLSGTELEYAQDVIEDARACLERLQSWLQDGLDGDTQVVCA